MDQAFIEILKTRLSQPLPGRTAQSKMAPASRHEVNPAPDARIACVLVLLYPKNKDWNIVLIERVASKIKNDRHSGQISFPGGKYEAFDKLLESTALRESEEEIGVFSPDISIIGQLSDVYIPVSNFLVYPFVGFMEYTPEFVPQPSEVKSILEVPIPQLKDPSTIRFTNLKISSGMTLENVPYYDIHGHIVWGATAMMLSEFVDVLPVEK